MDGNRRWSKMRGLTALTGHRSGMASLRSIIQEACQLEIPNLSVFAFSQDNWQRSEEETNGLMMLMLKGLAREAKVLHDQQIKIQFIGDHEGLSKSLIEKMHESEQLTEKNSRLTFTIAVNYSGQWDMLQACQQLIKHKLPITTENLRKHLSTHAIPDPDLLIRTSGEQRISNFFLWQLAYTELYFSDVLWPDFDAYAFRSAVNAYYKRSRRFGAN